MLGAAAGSCREAARGRALGRGSGEVLSCPQPRERHQPRASARFLLHRARMGRLHMAGTPIPCSICIVSHAFILGRTGVCPQSCTKATGMGTATSPTESPGGSREVGGRRKRFEVTSDAACSPGLGVSFSIPTTAAGKRSHQVCQGTRSRFLCKGQGQTSQSPNRGALHSITYTPGHRDVTLGRAWRYGLLQG